MLNHIFLGCNDLEKAKGFYSATMGALGHQGVDMPYGVAFPSEGGTVIIAKPANGEAANVANGATLGLKAKSYGEVDAWHSAGLENGGTDEGAPGFRSKSPGNMYGAYLIDPEGHKICVFTPNVGDR